MALTYQQYFIAHETKNYKRLIKNALLLEDFEESAYQLMPCSFTLWRSKNNLPHNALLCARVQVTNNIEQLFVSPDFSNQGSFIPA